MGVSVGGKDKVGLGLGAGLEVGEAEGLGPGPVGGSVGAALMHLSALMPKHCSLGSLHTPVEQRSLVQQFASASEYVAAQKNLL